MKISYESFEAEILELGAYLYSLTKNSKDLILKGNLEKPTHGGMAILIPYANRVKGGEYEFDGIKYILPKNQEGNAIHGLVLDKKWDIILSSTNSIKLKYILTHPGYPTTLENYVNYILDNKGLEVAIIVKNIGNMPAPLTIGAHPYFVVSNDWRLRTNGVVLRCEIKDKIPTGRLYSFNLSSGEFDDCFLVENDIELISSYQSVIVKRKNMPYIQVYTGVKGAVAVEPMSGAPDAFHNGLGLVIIYPGEEREFWFKLIFS